LRAMQHIQQLERRPRGIYCGTIGYAAPDDRAVFSVAIRTLSLNEGRATMGTGSGVVWDSDADAEYDECLLKAQFLQEATEQAHEAPLTLIETMRWTEGSIPLLERHLHRLADSAAYWGMEVDMDACRGVIRDALPSLDALPHRVRLTLTSHGHLRLRITVEELSDAVFQTVGFASVRIDPSNAHRYHKTNRRGVYDEALKEAAEAGVDEPLLLNTRGQVCEGARSNLFIRRGDALVTPPVHCGLLPGVYRAHVLDTHPDAREAVLYPEDVYTADALFVCNAVRGWQEVTLQPTPAMP